MFAVLIGIGFTLLGNFFPAEILKLMGADADILSIGTEYLQIAMLFSPFFIANYTFTAFVRNDNAPNIAMAATLLSSLFNIVFDYVFMFPMHMGMRGAALATGVSPIISIGICMIHYLSKKNTIVFKWHLPSFKLLASAAGLGVVAFVGEIANSITTLVFNFILLALSGNNAVAAYGVIANIALVGTAIFNGVSQGLQPLASTSYGHGDKEDVKKILRQSLVIAVILSIVLVSAVWVFAQGLVGIFNSAQSAELAKFAVPGLRIYFLGFLVAAVNIVLAGFFSATGQALASSLIAVSRGIIVISLMAFMLSKLFGVTGVWMAFPVTEVVTFGIAMGTGRGHHQWCVVCAFEVWNYSRRSDDVVSLHWTPTSGFVPGISWTLGRRGRTGGVVLPGILQHEGYLPKWYYAGDGSCISDASGAWLSSVCGNVEAGALCKTDSGTSEVGWIF